jgi:nucleoside-diphosphate-sugar epimerase
LARVFKADEEGHVSGYIIAPSTVYGVGDGPVRTISQQIPNLIKKALEQKKPLYIGAGTAVWNNVSALFLSGVLKVSPKATLLR